MWPQLLGAGDPSDQRRARRGPGAIRPSAAGRGLSVPDARELRWLYDRRDFAEARRDLAAWLARWQATYPKLCVGKVCVGVEAPIEETLTFYRLPREHHKHPKSTNLLERLNEAIKRRTHMVRIFPNGESCLRLIRALAVERHENWLEAHRYLNIDDRREHKKEDPAHGGMTRTRSHSPQGPPPPP